MLCKWGKYTVNYNINSNQFCVTIPGKVTWNIWDMTDITLSGGAEELAM